MQIQINTFSIRTRWHLPLAVFGSALVSMGSLSGAVLFTYDPTTDNTTFDAKNLHSSVTDVSDLSKGSGLSITSSGTTYTLKDYSTTTNSGTAAIDAGDTLVWSFKVQSGQTIDLTSIHTHLNNNSTGPKNFEFFYKVNSGSQTSLQTGTVSNQVVTINLATIPTLTAGDRVEFTLAAYNASSSTGALILKQTSPNEPNGQALYVYGTAVAVPEPSSAALLGLAGLALILRRRK